MPKRSRSVAKRGGGHSAQPPPSRYWDADLLIYLLLAIATLAVYAQVRQYDFVNFDDPAYVAQNSLVRAGLTMKSFEAAFTTTAGANWLPATLLSLMLDRQFFGLNAGWYHLTNVLLHLLNTLLLFSFLKSATGVRWASATVALLFALHPLHVESVAWVAERKDVLSSFFGFLTLLAYLHYVKRPGAYRYGLICLTFCLALMSKPMMITLPFALLILDLWPLHRFQYGDGLHKATPLIWEKMPLIALSIAVSIVTFLAQERGEAVAPLNKYPLGLRLENAVVSYVVYIVKMIWPSRLAFFTPTPLCRCGRSPRPR